VIGLYYDAEPNVRSFLCSNGKFIDLGSFGASKINDFGQIAGSSGDGTPAIYFNGKLTDLGLPPGATSASAYSINNSGTVIGYSDADHNTGPGTWIYTAGKFAFLKDLIPSSYFIAGLIAIDDSGRILIAAALQAGETSSLFMLTPVLVKP
jgi:uncharacterized membrane protein